MFVCGVLVRSVVFHSEDDTPDGIPQCRPAASSISLIDSVDGIAEGAAPINGFDKKQENRPADEVIEMSEILARERIDSADESAGAVRLHFEPDVVVDVNDVSGSNRTGGSAHRAKSVPSHWNDSRISVEMHLALCIEDLMLLAPGAAGTAKKADQSDGASLEQRQSARAESLDNSVVGQESSTLVARPSGTAASMEKEALPVEFDEDAEPDITLEHVLAGVDYLLRTRIIGTALPAAENKHIAEEVEIDEAGEDDEQNDDEVKSNGDIASPDDKYSIPAPLVAAPDSQLVSAVTQNLPEGAAGVSALSSVALNAGVGSKSKAAHPYFYFVSLDLALCDDLVTALCYHMRRAEQKWSLKPKPSAEALKALQLFHDFFRFVYSFRVCVAARPASYLCAALKVGRHLRSSDAAHRRLIVRVLLALEAECPRVGKWEALVEEPDDQARVREIARGSSEMKRLARALKGHRPQLAEMSHSFQLSRGETESKMEGANGGSLVQNLPAFYSMRHKTLLPPKSTFFDVEPGRLMAMFKTDLTKGLCSDEIAERQAMYGKNELPPPHEPSWFSMIWAQLKDFIILVLIAASVISMAVQDWKAAGVLLFVVLINVVIGLVQEYRSAQALKALSSFSVPQAQLLRDGEIKLAPASELVPGDIIQLDEGALVPADVRVVQVSQLATIEAILTGESLPILKSTAAIRPRHGSAQRRFLPVGDRINMAFMSTLVSKGRALAVVVNTGATTEVGRIYSALNNSNKNGDSALTPLQRKLASLGKWLVLIALVSCALVVAIGLGRGYGEDIVHIGISLAVSVIPEGLVTVVTLTMAVGVTRMAARKAIVRNLPAVETLGSVSTICSDKTGTLTEGNMRTECMWTLGGQAQATEAQKLEGNTLRFISALKNPIAAGASASSAADVAAVASASGSGVTALLDEKVTIRAASDLPTTLQWHALVCGMNNNAVVKMQSMLNPDGTTREEETMVGDATEVALLRASQQAHCSVTHWESTYGLKRVLEYAFDSDRKRMSVIVALPAVDSAGSAAAIHTFVGVRRPANASHVLLCKGAPEGILTRSVSHLSPVESSADGSLLDLAPLSESIERAIESSGSRMANQGMRVLATGFRFLTQQQVDEFQAVQLAATSEEAQSAPAAVDNVAADASPEASASDLSCSSAESQLCFIGLAGIMDPPRPEVADAIARAHRAGIRVCMITGDHAATALSIAKQIGIFSDARGDRAMNGDALAVLSEEQLATLDPFPVVFSRVSPENKLKLVKSLQRRGEVAAMTGDGVNDSPAIRAADVGIAMGQGGTEVTRQASDIVLSDDNFATIVFAVEEGRRIVDNIIKFLVYLLSCNGAEVAIMLTAVCAGWEVPYLPLMILWANIFVDIPPSLALGLEKVDAGAMHRRPRSNTAGILSTEVLLVMAFDAAVMALIVLLNYWHMIYVRNTTLGYARSFAFLLLALIHLLHAWVSSSLSGTIFRRDLISNNPSMLWALIVSVAFVLGGHYIPGLNDILELEPIEGHEWGIMIWNIAVFLVAVELRKLAMRIYARRKSAVQDEDRVLHKMTVQDPKVGLPAQVQ